MLVIPELLENYWVMINLPLRLLQFTVYVNIDILTTNAPPQSGLDEDKYLKQYQTWSYYTLV